MNNHLGLKTISLQFRSSALATRAIMRQFSGKLPEGPFYTPFNQIKFENFDYFPIFSSENSVNFGGIPEICFHFVPFLAYGASMVLFLDSTFIPHYGVLSYLLCHAFQKMVFLNKLARMSLHEVYIDFNMSMLLVRPFGLYDGQYFDRTLNKDQDIILKTVLVPLQLSHLKVYALKDFLLKEKMPFLLKNSLKEAGTDNENIYVIKVEPQDQRKSKKPKYYCVDLFRNRFRSYNDYFEALSQGKQLVSDNMLRLEETK